MVSKKDSTARVLTRSELNRALLARQMLLERTTLPIPAAVERLVGLQAQVPNPPYIGLWIRLHAFQRDDLTRLMASRQIVRAAMMRSTLHLVTAADHQQLRQVHTTGACPRAERFFRSTGQGAGYRATGHGSVRLPH
jgi:hypothetical protein